MYEGEVKSNASPYLNVRDMPSKEGMKVGALKPGQAVEVDYFQAGWAHIVSPVVSNKPDKQWALASFLDLEEKTDPETPGEDPTPDPEPGPARTDMLHVAFTYDEQGDLVKVNILEQFSDGTSLTRDWYPNA